MNNIKMQTKFDYKTMKYLNLYLMKYKRKTMLIYIVLIVLSLGFGSYLFISSFKQESGPNYIWPVAFGLITAYTIFQMATIERNLDKHLRNYFRTRPLLTEEIELSDEKITITVCTRPNKPQDYDWAFVSEIIELPGYYFLFINNNTPIILEKNLEAFLEGDLDELSLLIKEKCETKPYKRVDKEIVRRPIPEINYIDPVIEEEVEETDENKTNATEVEVLEENTVASEEAKAEQTEDVQVEEALESSEESNEENNAEESNNSSDEIE